MAKDLTSGEIGHPLELTFLDNRHQRRLLFPKLFSKSGSEMLSKFKQTMELEGVGTEDAGSDGTTVWTNSAITGAKLVDGTMAEQLQLRGVPFSIAGSIFGE
jgi:hypothetical protein